MNIPVILEEKTDGILIAGHHPCSGWAFILNKDKIPPVPHGTTVDLTVMTDGGRTILIGEGLMRGDKNMFVGQGTLKISDEKPHEFDFKKAYNSLADMQVEKNKRYAGSALKPLDIFARHHPYGARIDEKLARVKTADKLRKNDIADIIGGCMLLCAENGWDDFTDLID